jgi:hypothetical protein
VYVHIVHIDWHFVWIVKWRRKNKYCHVELLVTHHTQTWYTWQYYSNGLCISCPHLTVYRHGDILKAIGLSIIVFYAVTPYSLVEVYRPFGEPNYLCVQVSPEDGNSIFLRSVRKVPWSCTTSHRRRLYCPESPSREPLYCTRPRHRPYQKRTCQSAELSVCLEQYNGSCDDVMEWLRGVVTFWPSGQNRGQTSVSILRRVYQDDAHWHQKCATNVRNRRFHSAV